jgi:hypothetical protein
MMTTKTINRKRNKFILLDSKELFAIHIIMHEIIPVVKGASPYSK